MFWEKYRSPMLENWKKKEFVCQTMGSDLIITAHKFPRMRTKKRRKTIFGEKKKRKIKWWWVANLEERSLMLQVANKQTPPTTCHIIRRGRRNALAHARTSVNRIRCPRLRCRRRCRCRGCAVMVARMLSYVFRCLLYANETPFHPSETPSAALLFRNEKLFRFE